MNSLDAAEDSLLLELFLGDNQQAFAVLVKRYQSVVYSTAKIVTKSRPEAEDILQETFCKFCLAVRSGRYKHSGKLSGYLVRLAHNLAMDYIRKQHSALKAQERMAGISSWPHAKDETTLDRMIACEGYSNLRNSLTMISAEYREILLLRYFSKMKVAEISDLTGLNCNTVLSRARRGILEIRKIIDNQEDLVYDTKLCPH